MNKIEVKECPGCKLTREVSEWCNLCEECFSKPFIACAVNILKGQE